MMYGVLTRKADRERFCYGFSSVVDAHDFQRRNRAPMPENVSSPYGVSEILYRRPSWLDRTVPTIIG
jgi:hypothetical protein